MTTRGAQAITWDVENRPVTDGSMSFVYDGDGNRVEQTSGGQTTLYINQYYEINVTTGVATTSYYLGGQLVAQVGATMKYLPFGGTRTGSVNTTKEFTGQRLDATGLYYYNARYYDPLIGRFISPDTVVQDYKNPQTLNRYSYCLNNPLRYTDATGHEEVYVTNEGINDNGDFWYCVYSDKEQNNLISIVTGADNLPQCILILI